MSISKLACRHILGSPRGPFSSALALSLPDRKGAMISGSYEIDPDGAGGDPPFSVQCDFENGKYYLPIQTLPGEVIFFI